jgi:ADP-heptose:LPS heptosyltransferase
MSGVRQLPATLLVDLPNWVGDQMMVMPAVHRLVEANRGGETVLHTRPPMARFLSAVFPETRVVASVRKASPFSSARELREGGRRFEIGVTLRNAARAKILIRLSARWCAGSTGEGALVVLSARCTVDRSRHQVHDADSILAALGLEAVGPDWSPTIPNALKEEGEAMLRRLGVDRERAIGVAPSTARGDTKRWPAQSFGELAIRLRGRGWEPVVVIGPGEKTTAEKVSAVAGGALPVVGLDSDVAGLAAAVVGLRALVGNDSGPMQLAACLGTPVVAIFGPSEPGRTAPQGAEHRVLCRALECSPCTAARCPLDHHDCMRGISVDEVEAATFDLFDGNR